MGLCPHLALANIFSGNLGKQVGLSLWTVVVGEERDRVEIPGTLDLRSKMSGWKEPQTAKQHSPPSTAAGLSPAEAWESAWTSPQKQRSARPAGPHSQSSLSLCSRSPNQGETEEEGHSPVLGDQEPGDSWCGGGVSSQGPGWRLGRCVCGGAGVQCRI